MSDDVTEYVTLTDADYATLQSHLAAAQERVKGLEDLAYGKQSCGHQKALQEQRISVDKDEIVCVGCERDATRQATPEALEDIADCSARWLHLTNGDHYDSEGFPHVAWTALHDATLKAQAAIRALKESGQ